MKYALAACVDCSAVIIHVWTALVAADSFLQVCSCRCKGLEAVQQQHLDGLCCASGLQLLLPDHAR